MTKRIHIARQESQTPEQGLQIRVDDPAAPIDNQLWLNVSNNSINIAKSGGVIRLNDASFTETVTITANNILTKTITLSKNVQYPSRTKVFPHGGPPQIYSTDFTVISPNIISWGNMGLDGIVEEGDSFVIEYF
jgi:hypothetical protein